ncbi:MAG TPA: hypothetical protein VJ527_02700 [Rhodanobacter sp.]|nr:hypothetical protein [Rhodanobacter sp.]
MSAIGQQRWLKGRSGRVLRRCSSAAVRNFLLDFLAMMAADSARQ